MTAKTAPTTRLGLIAVATLLGALLLAALALAARPDAAAGQDRACPNANVPATELSERALRRATTCLINRVRVSRGLGKVSRDGRLQRVAQRHSGVMVNNDCLAHRCAGQPRLQRRIRRSGYLDDARRWRFAQSTGCARTARAMINAWRAGKYHRSNLLGPGFRDIGVGVLTTAPARCEEGMGTFVALLAWRIP